jgi:DNA-binding CsgD family transcriptional regulator
MATDHFPSKRGQARRRAKARQVSDAAEREAVFEAMAAGWSPQQIADARNVSVKTIRREIDRALAERRLDARDHYAHLQVARLTKALRLADAMIERGELKAVAPLVKVVAALDRYHGLGLRSLPAAPRAPLAIPPEPPALLLSEPAPPLALTCAAPPLDEAVPVASEGT